MRRCVVFGGLGFIGRHIVNQLAHTGRAIVCVDRFRAKMPKLPKNVTFVHSSTEPAFYKELLNEDDEVIDLAYSSVPTTSFTDPISDISDNLPRAVHLFQAAVAKKTHRLILISSGGAIYGHANYLPIDEKHHTLPISPYGITKLAVENYARMYHLTQGLPIIVLRPGNAYGPEQIPFRGQGLIATAIGSALLGKDLIVFGEEGAIRDYIHISDISNAILSSLESGQTGMTYNVGTGRGFSTLGIIEMLTPLCERNGTLLRTHHQPERTYDVRSNILDASQLQQHTGWSAVVPLEQGLLDTWKWYLSHQREWK